jgi:predicted ATPase
MFRFFEFENFRSFQEQTSFEFSGVNILTGKNSSGKSSLFKALDLCKENFSGTKFPNIIRFDGGDHGMGSIKYALNSKIQTQSATLAWSSFTTDAAYTGFTRITYGVDKKNKEQGFVRNVEFYDQVTNKKLVEIGYLRRSNDNAQRKLSFYIDFKSLYEALEGMAVPQDEKIKPIHERNYGLSEELSIIQNIPDYEEIIAYDIIEDEVDVSTDYEDWELQLYSDSDLWDALLRVLEKIFSDLEDKKLAQIIPSLLLRRMELHFFKGYNAFLNNGFRYLRSTRGLQNKLYLDNQNQTAINRVAKEFAANLELMAKVDFTEQKVFFYKWLKKFEIGADIHIGRQYGAATTIEITTFDGEKRFLSDLGFGATQLLVVLMEITNLNLYSEKYNRGNSPFWVIAVEEPEANLHPDFQTQLADMFAEAWMNFKTQFIIETHSEYLIRKMQLIVAKKQYGFEYSDLEVYYFNNPKLLKKGQEQVTRLIPKEDGSFEQPFGPGFYDEASKLVMQLYDL